LFGSIDPASGALVFGGIYKMSYNSSAVSEPDIDITQAPYTVLSPSNFSGSVFISFLVNNSEVATYQNIQTFFQGSQINMATGLILGEMLGKNGCTSVHHPSVSAFDGLNAFNGSTDSYAIVSYSDDCGGFPQNIYAEMVNLGSTGYPILTTNPSPINAITNAPNISNNKPVVVTSPIEFVSSTVWNVINPATNPKSLLPNVTGDEYDGLAYYTFYDQLSHSIIHHTTEMQIDNTQVSSGYSPGTTLLSTAGHLSNYDMLYFYATDNSGIGPPSNSNTLDLYFKNEAYSATKLKLADHSSTKDDTNIELFPNPALDRIIINSKCALTSASLFSCSGQLIANFTGNKQQIQADINLSLKDLNAGFYLLKFTDSKNKEHVAKLIHE
jgi:hypothetical protein